MNRRLGLACLAALAMAAPPLKAEIVTSLFATGVDQFHLRLLGNVLDPHWTITNPDGTLAGAFTLGDGIVGGRGYIGDQLDSGWVQPGSGLLQNAASGTYIYSTTFDMTGFDPTQTSITFRVAADNRIAGVLLNGNLLGFTYDGPGGNGDAFTAFSAPFTISNPAFFAAAINQLQFLVVNDPLVGAEDCKNPENPTGMMMVATAQSIPEPSTFALVGAGLGIFAFRRFRKKTS